MRLVRASLRRSCPLPIGLFLLALLPPNTFAIAPDLAEAARSIERFASTRGSRSDSARLQEFFELYWAVRVREFPDFAVSVGYPGLGDRWPDLSPESMAFIHRTARQERDALSSIDRSRLGVSEQLDFDLLRRRLDLQIEGERFHDLEPFRNEYLLIDQLSGIDIDLVTTLGFMPARTAADFDAMLGRLRGFPQAVDQALACLARGLASGITPPRITLRRVPERVLSLATDDPWKSSVLMPFQRIPDGVSAPDRERIRREAASLFAAKVAPALRRLHGYLVGEYVPRARESIAMGDLPDGAAWYAHELKLYTTTSKSPAEIHELGLAEVRRIRAEMDAIIASTGFHGTFSDFSRFLRTDPRFFYVSAEDLVAGYRDIAKRIDPELVRLFRRLPQLPYGVKAMEGDAAKTAPSGYYSNGSLSGGVPAWFLVNTDSLNSRPKWEMEALTLHEAVPGHHLQYAIAEELGELPLWRKWDVYPPFSEGWALYAEGLGEEIGLYKDPYSRFGRLNNEVWRAIRLVVDTGLQTMGWTRQQAIDYCRANSAKTEHDIEQEIDRYIVQPGTVPAYKIGELKIRELRRYAEAQLGSAFDVRDFHDHLLGGGQLPLDLLEKRIRDWVAECKPAQATR